MEEKLVSVIIPAYNAAQFLSRSVESARKQTWKNIEILVIDDGSADRTAEIARELEKKDARVRLVTKENGGVSSARNCGMIQSLRSMELSGTAKLQARTMRFVRRPCLN